MPSQQENNAKKQSKAVTQSISNKKKMIKKKKKRQNALYTSIIDAQKRDRGDGRQDKARPTVLLYGMDNQLVSTPRSGRTLSFFLPRFKSKKND